MYLWKSCKGREAPSEQTQLHSDHDSLSKGSAFVQHLQAGPLLDLSIVGHTKIYGDSRWRIDAGCLNGRWDVSGFTEVLTEKQYDSFSRIEQCLD